MQTSCARAACSILFTVVFRLWGIYPICPSKIASVSKESRMMRLCVQEFMSDQAATLANVSDYCSATNLSRAVDPYVYSYDQSRQFLYCRNHKVSHQ